MLPRPVSNFEGQAILLRQPLSIRFLMYLLPSAYKSILSCFYHSIREILTVTGSHTLPHSYLKKNARPVTQSKPP